MSRIAASTYCGSTIGLIAGRGPAEGPSGIQVSPVCPMCKLSFAALIAQGARRAAETELEKTRRFIIGISLLGELYNTQAVLPSSKAQAVVRPPLHSSIR